MKKDWSRKKTPLTQESAVSIAKIMGIHDSPEQSIQFRGNGPDSNPYYMPITPDQVKELQSAGQWEPLINSDVYSDNPKGNPEGGHQVETRRLNLIANGQAEGLYF